MDCHIKNKYHEQWERLGESDPYWAVLTDPRNKVSKWNSTDFFQTGEKEIESVFSKLKELSSEITFNVSLDFGCGVGRLSRALATKFGKVIAVDVSSSMLREARKVNHDVDNIVFLRNSVDNLAIISSNSIDFLYSNIVLQHMPHNRQAIYIREFCRVLRPRGILVFQTPSKCNFQTWKGWLYKLLGNKVLNLVRRIKYGQEKVMEVHTLARKIVLEILLQEGMNLIRIERYDSAGPAFKSYMYYAKKSYRDRDALYSSCQEDF